MMNATSGLFEIGIFTFDELTRSAGATRLPADSRFCPFRQADGGTAGLR